MLRPLPLAQRSAPARPPLACPATPLRRNTHGPSPPRSSVVLRCCSARRASSLPSHRPQRRCLMPTTSSSSPVGAPPQPHLLPTPAASHAHLRLLVWFTGLQETLSVDPLTSWCASNTANACNVFVLHTSLPCCSSNQILCTL